MTGATGLAWMLAAIAAAAGGAAVWAWRTEGARRQGVERERDELRAAVEAEREGRVHRERSLAERGRELAELRRKLDKTRKRAFEARESTGSLEDRLAELETEARSRRQQAEQAARESEGLREQLQRQTQELERLRGQAGARSGADAPPRVDAESLERLQKRAGAAEAEIRDLTVKLLEAERETTRYRTRERTHRRLYMVIKGELEAAQGRLRLLERSPDPGPAGRRPEAGSGTPREGGQTAAARVAFADSARAPETGDAGGGRTEVGPPTPADLDRPAAGSGGAASEAAPREGGES